MGIAVNDVNVLLYCFVVVIMFLLGLFVNCLLTEFSLWVCVWTWLEWLIARIYVNCCADTLMMFSANTVGSYLVVFCLSFVYYYFWLL